MSKQRWCDDHPPLHKPIVMISPYLIGKMIARIDELENNTYYLMKENQRILECLKYCHGVAPSKQHIHREIDYLKMD